MYTGSFCSLYCACQCFNNLVGVVCGWSLVFSKASGGGTVKAITSDSDFQKELALNSESLIVVDFFTTW